MAAVVDYTKATAVLELAIPSVPPGARFGAQFVVAVAARYDTLVIDTHEDYTVFDITVNGETQLAGPAGLPAALFAPNKVGVRLSLGNVRDRINGLLPQGAKFGLVVQNDTPDPKPFKARLLAMPR